MKLPGVLHNVSKRSGGGSLNTPGSTTSITAPQGQQQQQQQPVQYVRSAIAEEEKSSDGGGGETSLSDTTVTARRSTAGVGVRVDLIGEEERDGRKAREGSSSGSFLGQAKNVAWKDGGGDAVSWELV